MSSLYKFILDYVWGKLVKEGIPWLLEKLKIGKRKRAINKEQDELKEELEDLQQRAQDWLRANPGKPLPKSMEDRLRDAARRNNRL